jgi:uncharacterized protein
MEAQYFESEPKGDNVILKILMVVAIIFILVLMIYTFVAIQNKSKETKYIGISSSSSNNTINVSETSVAYAVPNEATMTFTTISKGSSINDVLTLSNNSANSVLDFLKRQGITGSDAQISDFNIYPQYQWQTANLDTSVYPIGKRIVSAYQATQSIKVNVKDTTQTGNIIQGALAAGASQVSSITLVVADEESYKQQARDAAIVLAKARATEIAKGLGVKLGDAVGYTESYVSAYDNSSAATTGTGTALQISTGESKIQATVNISYQIK